MDSRTWMRVFESTYMQSSMACSARAACTAALRTLTATCGLRAATAASNGASAAVSYGNTLN